MFVEGVKKPRHAREIDSKDIPPAGHGRGETRGVDERAKLTHRRGTQHQIFQESRRRDISDHGRDRSLALGPELLGREFQALLVAVGEQEGTHGRGHESRTR